jgi:cyclin A
MVPKKCFYLFQYLSELSLLEADPYLQYYPSVLAAACIALARHTLDQEAWPEGLEEATRYKFEDLKPCISYLNQTYSDASVHPQQAIRKKYKADR